MSTPKKYQDIDFSPPQEVADLAAKGLVLRREFERGGTEVGVARARDLKNQKNLSPDTITRMNSYFSRHQSDKEAENFGNAENPSAGYIAWLLWGGDPGRDWAEQIADEMEKADNES
ncbi:hypothetical protein [Roseibacillus persicicus]|uniref:hypothetical protein n=1 Tax=Roseibacillus persicicus TaxID=454148 RepID=UPI00280C45C4|nr:hypothetical protein [Roseibacillus persicicus]MDQ8192210.1 hypothetical protein [Roseibacillus persicicus]